MSRPYVLTELDRSRLAYRMLALAAPTRYIPRPEPTDDEIARATELAWSMYGAAAELGYSPEDLAPVTSIPCAAWDVVRARTSAGVR